MIWLVPVGVVGAVVAIALLWPRSSAAGARGGIRPPITDGGGDDKPAADDQGGPFMGLKPLPDLIAEPLKPPTVSIYPTPTAGGYYRIKPGDMGTLLTLQAYSSPKPFATWLKVVPHAVNQEMHAGTGDSWFLPRWDLTGTVNTGKFTGMYALVYMPPRSQVGL